MGSNKKLIWNKKSDALKAAEEEWKVKGPPAWKQDFKKRKGFCSLNLSELTLVKPAFHTDWLIQKSQLKTEKIPSAGEGKAGVPGWE